MKLIDTFGVERGFIASTIGGEHALTDANPIGTGNSRHIYRCSQIQCGTG